MTNFIFREQPPGHLRHTALSAHLSRSPSTVAFQRTLATVFNPANACIPTALRSNPATASLTQTAHNAARATALPFYAWLDSTADTAADRGPDLRAVFDTGMEGISRGGQRLQDTDLRAYPWASILPPDATVVDVGGSRGHFARDLTETNPAFRVVVQDLPRVVEGLAAEFATAGDGDGGVGDNVTYQAHDFFDEQPVVGADVYFMRHVMHNHPDAECVAILRALLPALREGGRVLVSEYIVPPYEDLAGGLGTKAMR